MTKQVSKEYQTSDKTMAAYLAEVRKLEKKFIGLEVKYISRKDNCLVDSLARLASSHAPGLPGVFVEKITSKVAKRFIMKNVVTRFGVPSRLITDNGTQFSSAAFIEYCERLGTKI